MSKQESILHEPTQNLVKDAKGGCITLLNFLYFTYSLTIFLGSCRPIFQELALFQRPYQSEIVMSGRQVLFYQFDF